MDEPLDGGIPIEQLYAHTQTGPTASQPAGEPGERPLEYQFPRLKRGPLSNLVLILAAIGVAVAAGWALRASAGGGDSQVPILLAKRGLPAYRMLTSEDFTLGVRTASGHGAYATLPVGGRLTLRAIKPGQPIMSADLSPNVTNLLHANPTVVGIDVSRAAVLGGTMVSGDIIQIVLSRKSVKVGKFEAVVLSTSANGPASNWSLVVAVKAADARRFDLLFPTSHIAVLLNPAAQR